MDLMGSKCATNEEVGCWGKQQYTTTKCIFGEEMIFTFCFSWHHLLFLGILDKYYWLIFDLFKNKKFNTCKHIILLCW